ncbi:MAG: hypothetical protein ABJA98_32310 [Acidobacteriota bacterium]
MKAIVARCRHDSIVYNGHQAIEYEDIADSLQRLSPDAPDRAMAVALVRKYDVDPHVMHDVITGGLCGGSGA